ncbi:MAG: hypothetical protein M1309_06025 [Actinobacteria bacterium]|nr:hypothetical protein [Actinomycetota bacterium]
MPSERTNEATRREWRELGFFYDRDDDAKVWRIIGTRIGVQSFISALAKFASNLRNERLSEHDHLGPYMYLKIGSWPEPEITDDWIAGPLWSLGRLSDEIKNRVAEANNNESLLFREFFAPDSLYELSIELRPEPFDPAKEDPNCW